MDIDFKKAIAKIRAAKAKNGGRNPFRDWKTIVTAFSFVGAFLVGWSIYLFWGIYSGFIFNTPTVETKPAEKLDERAMNRIIEEYEKKAVDFEAVRASLSATSTAIDPSL